jgi:hypothetical protein
MRGATKEAKSRRTSMEEKKEENKCALWREKGGAVEYTRCRGRSDMTGAGRMAFSVFFE